MPESRFDLAEFLYRPGQIDRMPPITSASLHVERLKRSAMHAPEYREFIAPLFAGDRVERHLEHARWLFAENPAWEAPTDLPIYLCSAGSHRAGHLAVIPTRARAAGQEIRAGWCVDFFVDSMYRRRGIGGTLLDSAGRDFDVLMTLGQTDESFSLFLKLGWRHDGNRLTRYKSFLKKRRVLDFLLKRSGLSSGPFRERVAARRCCPDEPTRAAVLREDDVDTAAHDGKRRTAGIVKDRKYLDWRYQRHPFLRYRFYTARLENGKSLTFVWRVLDNETFCSVSVVDAIHDASLGPRDFRAGWQRLRRYLASRGVEVLECQTNDRDIISSWSIRDLSARRQGPRFLFSVGNLQAPTADGIGCWKLFGSDCDVDLTSVPLEVAR